MNKTIITLLFLLSIPHYSQLIIGKIVDKENNPVQGARIGIENEEIGDLSDSDGSFELDFTNYDKIGKIKVFVSEYQPYEVKISEYIKSNHVITLNKKVINIEEVKLSPKKYKSKNFGTSNDIRAYCGYNSENTAKISHEYAIKIENKKHLKIKTIHVNIVDSKLESPATLIFDVQNSSNGFPDDTKSLLNETLKLTITNESIVNNKVSIDVSDQNIWTNEDFFVTVRLEEGFKGKLSFGGNIFAFSKNTYYRKYFSEWQKFSVGEPSINVDVMIEK